MRYLLSNQEVAYLSGSKDLTSKQRRDIRYRLNQKLRLLGAAADLRDAAEFPYGGRWSSLVKIPQPIMTTVNERDDKTTRKSGGPDVIRTRDPRHVKAVS
jgi:hypothetical protein